MQKTSSAFINLFIVILILISAFIIFYIYSNVQENKTAANWEKTFGRIEDLPNLYPYRNDNEAAIRLKNLAVRLGINFALYGEGRNFLPQRPDWERLRGLDLDYSLWRYMNKQLWWRKDDSVDPPFTLLARYLADYRKKLEDVRDYLLTSPHIVWRQNLNWTSEYGQPTPELPNMSAISDLQRIMSARVLELTAARNYPEAEKYLEAQWKLSKSLKSLSDLTSQQDALHTDEQLMSLMRKLPLDQHWIPKIPKHDYEKTFVKGFIIEAWFLWQQRNEYKMTKSPVLNNIFDPYLRLGLSSELENEMEELQRLQAMNPCDIGYKELRETQNSTWDRIPWRWELYKKLNTYAEITEIKLVRELTTKVIKVKHGYFPKDGSERSEACKDGTWEYWRSPDGSITIKYKERIELRYPPSAKFPSSFTVKRP
jgi:hypothetical protein